MAQSPLLPQNPRAVARTLPHVRPLKLRHDFPDIQQDVRIEILPLIDVIFCILTFFILGAVGLSRQQAIGLDLPKATTGTPQMREMLVVSLDEFGQVYVEQQLVTPNQLYQSLQNYHQFNPNGLMVLHAARNTSYNEVVRILDMLRQVGGDRVALATLPGESEVNGGAYPGLNPLNANPGLPPLNSAPSLNPGVPDPLRNSAPPQPDLPSAPAPDYSPSPQPETSAPN